MPSARVKKAAKSAGKKGPAKAVTKTEEELGEDVEVNDENGVETVNDSGVEGVTEGLRKMTSKVTDDKPADNGRSCTGMLSSHPQSRDVHIESFTLLYHGHDLLVDARLELNHGRWVWVSHGQTGRHACSQHAAPLFQ